MAESDGQKRILYLNRSNYANWKVTTKWMLVKDKTWDVVQNIKPQPVTEDWINKNNLAMSRLMLSVSEDQLIYIRHLDVASEVWSTLQQLYERKTMCSKVFLYRKYWTKRFSSGTMRQHITDMQELASQLRTAGIELSVPEEVAGLLASLPESYDGLITALESRDESTLSMDFVSGKLLDEYARRFEHRTNGHDVDSAMFSTSSQKQKGKQQKIKESRSCYYCGKRGHLKFDCRKWKNDQASQSSSKEAANSVAQSKGSNQFTFIASEKAYVTDQNDVWLIDSGCTSHMTNNESFLREMHSTKRMVQLAGSGHAIPASGIGTGTLECKLPNGKMNIVNLHEVLFVPELGSNLISVSKLRKKGCEVHIDDSGCTISHGGNVAMYAKEVGDVYELSCAQIGCGKKTERSHHASAELWHRRLGHRDAAAIQLLHNEKLTSGIELLKENNKYKSDVKEDQILPNLEAVDVQEPEGGEELQPEIRKSTRVTKGQPPVRYCYQAEERNHSDPASWDDMLKMSTREQQKWRLAAKAEMASLDKHKVFELANLPVGQHAITSKWVFKSKRDENGQVHTFKARLVARGFSQRYGVDYDETFAPVVKHDTVRVLLAYAAARGQHVRHLDVKSAYLNGELKEELYMEQPQGFVVKGAEDQVLRLRKSLYGLKQAARAWNKTATLTLKQEGFKQSQADPCLFTKADKNNSRIHVLLYVDDMLVVGDNAEVTQRVGKQLDKYFEMKDLGDVRHYLGIQVERVKDGSFNIHQSTKILALVAEYGLLDAKPVITPMETGFLSNDAPSPELPNNKQYRKAVGSLLYLANLSRPDIALAVGILCRRVQTPTENDWKAVKRVICYLHTTVDQKLHFQTGGKLELTGFVDADWAGDHHDRKSTSGFLFQMGASTITWSSRKQTTVALSSTEAEYVAVSHACRELQWLKRLLQDLGISIDYPIILHEDNQGCIKLVASDRCGNRTKHIDVSHHFIRDLWDNNVINLRYCPTEQMVADILTKPLTKEKFLQLRLLIGLVKN